MNSQDIGIVLSKKFLDHRLKDQEPASHPEHPGRIEPLFELFSQGPFKELSVIEPVAAKEQLLLRVHTKELLDRLSLAAGKSGWIDSDTYYGPRSVETALLAAGSSVELALRIWTGQYRRGFSLVRPPGHHATPSRSMGFCFLNNVALCAAAILEENPNARLAIVDFDLHHGNGSQDAFYSNPNVLFLSSHRFPFYPGTGDLKENGEGKGRGTSVNFPLDRSFGDDVFYALYGEIVFPILKEFCADMILVSAGFDGHYLDPMQGFQLSTEAFAVMADILMAAAEANSGKILFCLEGGYNVKAVAESVRTVTRRLMEFPRLSKDPVVPEVSGSAIVDKFRDYYLPFFPAL